jgi:hypothetical protein
MMWDRRESIKASTNTRADLGPKLKGSLVEGQLNEAGNLGSGSIKLKVALSSVGQIDDELLGWLKDAYYNAG